MNPNFERYGATRVVIYLYSMFRMRRIDMHREYKLIIIVISPRIQPGLLYFPRITVSIRRGEAVGDDGRMMRDTCGSRQISAAKFLQMDGAYNCMPTGTCTCSIRHHCSRTRIKRAADGRCNDKMGRSCPK